MKRWAVVTALVALLVVGLPAQAAAPPAKRIAQLERENAALRARIKRLKADVLFAEKGTAIADKEADAARAEAARQKLRADAAVKDAGTLRGQVTALQTSVTTLTGERDQARNTLAAAQSGVGGVISTLAIVDVWNLLGSAIAPRFNSPQWSRSYYSTGDYRSWDFTYCGFCG